MINPKASWIAAVIAVVCAGFSLPLAAETMGTTTPPTTHHSSKSTHHASASAHHKSRAHHHSHSAHSSSHHSKPKPEAAPAQ